MTSPEAPREPADVPGRRAAGTAARGAELERLALLLHTDVGSLGYLTRFDANGLRALRTALRKHVAEQHRAAYQRIAAASRLLPAKATATLAQKRMPPRPAAAVVAELPPDHAADLAAAMRPDYLATVSRHLDSATGAAVAGRLPLGVLTAVLDELVADRDVVALAEMTGTLDEERLRVCVEAIEDADMLVGLALRVTDRVTLERLVRVLPPGTTRRDRVEAAARQALSPPAP